MVQAQQEVAPSLNHPQDQQLALVEQVQAALARQTPLHIQGGGSKAFYGLPVQAEDRLELSPHRGVIAYEASELAITVRAGTRLAEVQALLAAQEQQLPFEPPHFGANATIGGAVACGLSGPSRPYLGSVRDAVLGVKLINGRGQVLSFGGRVMKNVAGYDVSRLMVGALGTLGVLLEVSLKVVPRPKVRVTLVQTCGPQEAIARMRHWARLPLSFTGSAWESGRLYARLCGSEEALAEATARIGGEPLSEEAAGRFWRDLREHRQRFFQSPEPLWRLSVAPATPLLELRGEQVIEWGGALRWYKTSVAPDELRVIARRAGGHATLFHYDASQLPHDGNVFAPLDPTTMRLTAAVKQAFDPSGMFNPGHLYRDF